MEPKAKTVVRRLQVLSRTLGQTRVQKVHTAASESEIIPTATLEPSPSDLRREYEELFTKGAVNFVAQLVQTFDTPVKELEWRRLDRKCRLRERNQLPAIQKLQGTWKVAALPDRLMNRHLDLGDVSPSDLNHLSQALQAQVQGVQVDFDDGHCPTWRNQILGLHNVYKAVHDRLPGVPDIARAPVLMLRPRAWNMTEPHMMVNGKQVPGPLFDFGLLVYHNAHQLASCQSGPFLYLSKIEGANEAKLWDDIFVWTEHRLGLAHGTIRACVLIENILSSFELDDILFALKDHSLGLNCGIWDYSASIVAKFGDNKDFILPDRNKYVSMDRHFLKSYLQLVIQTCHLRGAPATGGMAAQLLPNTNDVSTIIKKVCEGKLKEIKEGVDGFLVYDIHLVPHMNKLWKDNAPGMNQLSVKREDVHVTAQDLLEMPFGGVTYAGLKHNIAVVIMFVYHWFHGRGHFCLNGNVEDSATAEISRSQIWQWIRHKTGIEDYNAVVTKDLVDSLATEFVKENVPLRRTFDDGRKFQLAKELFMDIVCKREFPDFITTYLNESHTFWSFHKTNP